MLSTCAVWVTFYIAALSSLMKMLFLWLIPTDVRHPWCEWRQEVRAILDYWPRQCAVQLAGGARHLGLLHCQVSGQTSLSGQWPAFTMRSVASLHCQVSGQPCLSGQWPDFTVRSVASLVCQVSGQPCLSGQWPAFTMRSVASLLCEVSSQPSLSGQWPAFSVRSVASLLYQVSDQSSPSGQWPAFTVRSVASLHCQISGQSSVTGQWPAFTVRSVASLPVLGQWPAFTVRSVASLHCQVSGQPSLSDQRPDFTVRSVASKQQGQVCCGSTDSAWSIRLPTVFESLAEMIWLFQGLESLGEKRFKFGLWKCEFLLLWTNWNADNSPALRTTVPVASCFGCCKLSSWNELKAVSRLLNCEE